MSFAVRLKEWREARGLSREQLSELCGLGRGTVRDYEQGRREPTFSSLVKLADALGVTLEAFRDVEPPAPARGRGPAGAGRKK